MMRTRAAVAVAITASVVLLALAACGGVTTRTTFPPLGSSPRPAGDSTGGARGQVVAALAAVGLQAAETTRSYRPPEGPLLAAAPRTVLQVTLPEDPAGGFIVFYAFNSAVAAQAAAEDNAAYIASGPGRVQFPPGSHYVHRIVGSTVVFFTWLPDAAPDPRTQTIEDTLLGIGSGVTVPS